MQEWFSEGERVVGWCRGDVCLDSGEGGGCSVGEWRSVRDLADYRYLGVEVSSECAQQRQREYAGSHTNHSTTHLIPLCNYLN